MSDPRLELGDPSTTPQRLFEIAQSNPELGAQIAAHPNAYPELQQWVAQLAPAAPEQPAAQPEPAAPAQPETPAAPVSPAPDAPVAPAAPEAPAAPQAPTAPAAFDAPAAPVAPQAFGAPAAPQAFGAQAAAPAAPQAYGAAPAAPQAFGAAADNAPTQAYPTADQSQFTQPTVPLAAEAGAGYPGGPVPPTGAAVAGGTQPPKKSRKGMWITIVSVVVVLALAATGGLIWWNISNKTSGAATPEEAASKVLTSFTSLDTLSIYGSVAPSEIAPFQDAMDKWMKDLNVEEDSDVQGKIQNLVDALDVKVDGVETTTEEIIEDVERVTYTAGTITVNGDKDKILDAAVELYEAVTENEEPGIDADQMRSSLESELDLPYTFDLADIEDGTGVPPSIVVVKEGDLWYMSPMLTVADIAYNAASEYSQLGSLGTSIIEGQPSDSAESAAADLADAIFEGDSLEDIAAHLPLAERRLLSIYGPAIDLPRGWNDDITLESAEFSADTDGGLARLNIENLTLSSEYYSSWAEQDLSQKIKFFDHCIEMTAERYDYYDDEVTEDTNEGCLADALPFYNDLGLDNMAIIAVEEDGGWYVSPIRTIADVGAIVASHMAKLAEEGRLEEVFSDISGI